MKKDSPPSKNIHTVWENRAHAFFSYFGDSEEGSMCPTRVQAKLQSGNLPCLITAMQIYGKGKKMKRKESANRMLNILGTDVNHFLHGWTLSKTLYEDE